MAKRKQNDDTGSNTVATPDDKAARSAIFLPLIEAPSVSPARQDAAPEPGTADTPSIVVTPAAQPESPSAGEAAAASDAAVDSAPAASPAWPKFRMRPRHRRYAMLAASVVSAAAVGAVVGAAATGGFYRPAPVSAAGLEENKAAQQSIARLSKEIGNLKASFEAANKSANAQFTKLTERLSRESAEITGAIKPPQTVPAASQTSAPLPPARPAPAAEAPRRPAIVTDWTIRETRDGFVYVQGHGDVYQVVPGAPLPGLGPVEQIRRQDGRWVVVTPKGIIVSMRDRRYFVQF
jgi:hypothetical protein